MTVLTQRREWSGFCAAVLIVGMMAAGCGKRPGGGAPVTLLTGLDRLTNVAAFAEAPAGIMAMQSSSYDRTGGNNDWLQPVVWAPDGLVTLADLKGPGCVRRLWMTNVNADEWLLFFDGERTPRIRAPSNELFGAWGPMRPLLAEKNSGGFCSYAPIPFAKSLRIAVAIPDRKSEKRPYFQVNYELFPRGSRVESFPRAIGQRESAKFEEVRLAWSNTAATAAAAIASCGTPATNAVAPGRTVTWLERRDAGTIEAFWVSLAFDSGATPFRKARALRELVLRFTWDGAPEASIEVPLGDFFCNGPYGRRRYAALPMAVTEDAFLCRLPMPFRAGARAEIRNDGPTPVTVSTACRIGPAPAVPATRYLHAAWNSSSQGAAPHRVLYAKGEGHLAGIFLVSLGSDGSWNILEGDDRIWVDGDSQASFQGTGLEDHFNSGWYYEAPFNRPLHGLIEKAATRTMQYRFYLPDPVPFRTSLGFNFEFGHGNSSRGYMSSVAYWYQTAPLPAGSRIPPPAARFPPSDQVEAAAFMSGLIGLERASLYEEAVARALEYAERVPDSPFAPLLRVRALAYRERDDGFDAVRDEYRKASAASPGSPASAQAAALLWVHEKPGNAAIVTGLSGSGRVYVDGNPAVAGAPGADMMACLTNLPPGRHEVTVEWNAATQPQMPWFYMQVRMAGTNLCSGASWRAARVPPANWPRSGDKDADWQPVDLHGSPPWMNVWMFAPNAFPDAQSSPNFFGPPRAMWEGKQQVTVFLRGIFDIP